MAGSQGWFRPGLHRPGRSPTRPGQPFWARISPGTHHGEGGSRSWGRVGASYSPDPGLGAQAGNELERCQRQADEVTEIMLNNFDKVLERDGKLSELEQRSDQLLDMV